MAELMGVLCVESRLKIIALLRDYESLCVNALACNLDISQSAVSQHLRILHFSGFVTSHKNGYYTHYRLNREKLDNSIKLLTQFAVRHEPINPSKCTSKGEKPCANVKENARNRKI
ncbi:MAG: metalloregulator ArsR/SmtB family transcription factor [Candidatus Aegiribacteria sp.]|nr:metalloregulator ArsR/SmtB family transcription factor [Candidatus Aegiribacteria sp.]